MLTWFSKGWRFSLRDYDSNSSLSICCCFVPLIPLQVKYRPAFFMVGLHVPRVEYFRQVNQAMQVITTALLPCNLASHLCKLRIWLPSLAATSMNMTGDEPQQLLQAITQYRKIVITSRVTPLNRNLCIWQLLRLVYFMGWGFLWGINQTLVQKLASATTESMSWHCLDALRDLFFLWRHPR